LRPSWKSVKSIGIIDSTREIGDKTSFEGRYYVSSLAADPAVFATNGLGHWGIEDSLHYVLDVTYREDTMRIKSGKGPENWAYFRKTGLTVARADRESRDSIKSRVKQMAWSGGCFIPPLLPKLRWHNLYALALAFREIGIKARE
jgi:predicted transposase YbfD/YdcC